MAERDDTRRLSPRAAVLVIAALSISAWGLFFIVSTLVRWLF